MFVYSQIENFHKNTTFLSNYNKFCVLLNSDLIIYSPNSIYIKKRAKSIATHGFSTLYIKLPHDKLKSKLSSIADFAFKGEDKTFIRLSNIGAVYQTKTKGDLVLVKLRLKQL